MIEVFTITHNIYDEAVTPYLSFYARAIALMLKTLLMHLKHS